MLQENHVSFATPSSKRKEVGDALDLQSTSMKLCIKLEKTIEEGAKNYKLLEEETKKNKPTDIKTTEVRE
uniref:Uncharacterized protein n=1 Tax=Noccaea caerulescens TaxID=107243 RepID=A0A1J3INE0_NOCCA